MKRLRWMNGDKFVPIIRHPDTEKEYRLKEAVYLAIGQSSSLHWPASKEIYKATEASAIAEDLLKIIYMEINS